MFDWDDLRYLLAVAEGGSTLAAGRALGVSQTTVARRVAALEAAFGTKLFERRQAGYAPTAAGAALVGPARRAAAAMGDVFDAAAALRRSVAGVVRLSAARIIADTVLPAILRDLHQSHGELMVEVDATDALVDLAAGAADVAIRSCSRPEGAGLVGRRIADDRWALYCSAAYADRNGTPTRTTARDHDFIGGGVPGVWKIYSAWLDATGLGDRVTVHHQSATGLLAAVRAGAGVAVLPCIVAEADASLVRCLPPGDAGARGLWLLTAERVRHAPPVRTLIDFLAERLTRLAAAMPDAPAALPPRS